MLRKASINLTKRQNYRSLQDYWKNKACSFDTSCQTYGEILFLYYFFNGILGAPHTSELDSY